MSQKSPEMKKDEPNKTEVGIIAVPNVEQALKALLDSGRFEPCPGSDNAVINAKTGVVPFNLGPFSGSVEAQGERKGRTQ